MKTISIDSKTEFATGGCNIGSSTVSWSETDIVAYGSGPYILILKLNHNDELIYDSSIYDGSEINFVNFVKICNTEILITCNIENEVKFYKKTTKIDLFYSLKISNKFIPNICIYKEYVLIFTQNDSIFMYIVKNILSLPELNIFNLLELGDEVVRSICIFDILDNLHIAFGGTTGLLNIIQIDNEKLKNYLSIHSKNGNSENIEISECLALKFLKIKAHSDWINSISAYKIGHDLRCLNNLIPGSTVTDLVFLATASQDHNIFIWKIEASEYHPKSKLFQSLKKHFLTITNGLDQLKFYITKDSVLLAHNFAVTNLKWLTNETFEDFPRLASVGMDDILIIWEFDKINNIWNDQVIY